MVISLPEIPYIRMYMVLASPRYLQDSPDTKLRPVFTHRWSISSLRAQCFHEEHQFTQSSVFSRTGEASVHSELSNSELSSLRAPVHSELSVFTHRWSIRSLRAQFTQSSVFSRTGGASLHSELSSLRAPVHSELRVFTHRWSISSLRATPPPERWTCRPPCLHLRSWTVLRWECA